MDEFIAIIKMFGFNFAPRGWAQCNGQIMSIAQDTALFSLLGTTYGGNGQTTFALPDLRGRVPVHQGPGFTLGQVGGSESVTLSTSQMTSHNHAPQAQTASGAASSPVGAFWAASDLDEFS